MRVNSDFKSIQAQFKLVQFASQDTPNATYVFVLNRSIPRLSRSSDILHVGETDDPIASRYQQETSTNNTKGNTQATNIRLTHVFGKLGLSTNATCHFTTQRTVQLTPNDPFLQDLMIWAKTNWRIVAHGSTPVVSLEKYLLVKYAVDHWELPPLNNSF